MKQYEIKTFTLCGGWVNTWMDDDETPVLFDTYSQAEFELKLHLQALLEAWENGDIEDAPESEDFLIDEVVEHQGETK